MYKSTVSAIFAASLVAAAARAGAPLAGMGGVGVGVAGATGDISDNPAASSATLRRHEGAFSAGASWLRLGFSGKVFNSSRTTSAVYDTGFPLSWGMVTPMFGAGRGRLAMGSWQLEQRMLQLAEPVDLAMAGKAGGAPLSASYASGLARMDQEESFYAHGISWVQTIFGGDHIISVGGAVLTQESHDYLDITAEELSQIGEFKNFRHVSRRSEMAGPGATLGWMFRPVESGNIGASLLYAGRMTGRMWEQADGGAVQADGISRGPQVRASVGGAVILLDALTVALDARYFGGMKADKKVFTGKPSARVYTEKSDAGFSIAAGTEYRLRMKWSVLPLRVGFFNKPDGMPSIVSGTLNSPPVGELLPVPYRQDVMGVTTGTGFESGPFRADIALAWLRVDTIARISGADGGVDSGDPCNTFGVFLSFSSRFGGTLP